MNIILSDAGLHKKFLPLSYMRALADFRVGILKIREKWERLLCKQISVQTEDYLQGLYELKKKPENIYINASVLPDKNLVDAIVNMTSSVLKKDNTVIAIRCSIDDKPDFNYIPNNSKEYTDSVNVLEGLYSIFLLNNKEIESDFSLITLGRVSAEISSTNLIFGNNPIFIEEDCFVEAVTINTFDGPVYIGKCSQIMEGSNIRGPFAVCENSQVKMGAKIYGATTIGPGCKVGGEINNSVIFGNSNKAHDGYLGNAVIGEWCNLGADTNNSNLKNNYSNVKVWNYEKNKFFDTGLQFCGLFMGDHSKSGINTMFNTGTVVGVSANVFGAGFPRNFIPSFSWGGHSGIKEYKLEIALETIKLVLARRGMVLTPELTQVMQYIYNLSSEYRNF